MRSSRSHPTGSIRWLLDAEARFWAAVTSGSEPVAAHPAPAPRPVGTREVCLEGNNGWASAAAAQAVHPAAGARADRSRLGRRVRKTLDQRHASGRVRLCKRRRWLKPHGRDLCEALDAGDLAIAKAMSSAYKSPVVQAFCFPTLGEDARRGLSAVESSPHDPARSKVGNSEPRHDRHHLHLREPGGARAGSDPHHNQLKAISRERRGLYDAIGKAFAKRTAGLAKPRRPPPAPPVRNGLRPGSGHTRDQSEPQMRPSWSMPRVVLPKRWECAKATRMRREPPAHRAWVAACQVARGFQLSARMSDAARTAPRA